MDGRNAASLTPTLIAELVSPVFDNHPIIEAYIFGSRARGTSVATSDVDFFCKVDRGVPFGMFALGTLTYELQNALNAPVDVITADSLETTNSRLFREIERDKVKVYERTQER